MPMLLKRAVTLHLYGMHAACKALAHIVSINQVHGELLKSLRAERACRIGCCANSYLHFSYPDITAHRPVAHKAVQRTLKTGGLIFLKAEMPHPRKAITAEQSVQQVLWLATRYRHGKAHQRQA